MTTESNLITQTLVTKPTDHNLVKNEIHAMNQFPKTEVSKDIMKRPMSLRPNRSVKRTSSLKPLGMKLR
jgi:predicted transcriptional regulator